MTRGLLSCRVSPSPFSISYHSSLSVADAFDRVSDVVSHPVPLTTVWWHGDGPSVGARFTARTKFGPVFFDDVMVVQRFDHPASSDDGAGRMVIEKVGRPLAGWADISVRPAVDGGPGCVVEWREALWLRCPAVPLVEGFTSWVAARVGPLVFGQVVKQLV